MSSSDFDDDDDDVDLDPDFNPNEQAGPSFPIVYQPSHEEMVTSVIQTSSSSSEDQECVEEQRPKGKTSRKRTRNPHTWKRNVNKKNKTQGKSYEGISKKCKIVKPSRQSGPDCRCKYLCFTRVSCSERNELFKVFNNVCDKEKQDIFLAGHIHPNQIQRRRSRSTNSDTVRKEKPHTIICRYEVKLKDKEIRVCKKAFCAIFGIGKARVERIIKCLQANNPCPKDLRGTHSNRPNRIREEIVNQIDDLIQSFPKRQSHYSRTKNENKFYLSPELNITKMHKLYLEKYEPDILIYSDK